MFFFLFKFQEKLLANLDDGQSEKNFAEDEEVKWNYYM